MIDDLEQYVAEASAEDPLFVETLKRAEARLCPNAGGADHLLDVWSFCVYCGEFFNQAARIEMNLT